MVATDSQILYTTAAGTSGNRYLYQFTENGSRITQDGVFLDTVSTNSIPEFIYGNSKLRVVYDVTDFDTTYSDQIVVPLAEIEKCIPNFDAATWAQTPLACRIVERGNVGVGEYVSVQGGVVIATGQRAYTTIGTASKVAVTGITISSSNLVVQLDVTGGTRQRVSCEITPLA